jgi:uncharacterized RDD family membrane protein YckC
MHMALEVGDTSADLKRRRQGVNRDIEITQLAAPFLLRCGAMAIDYILFIVFPVAFLLLSRLMGNDGTSLLSSDLNNVGWLIAILIGFTNLFLLPLVNGQSVGKMLTGIRIVSKTGRLARFRALLLRQAIGYPIVFFTLGAGFFLAAFLSSGRGLHDLLAGTIVIRANQVRR